MVLSRGRAGKPTAANPNASKPERACERKSRTGGGWRSASRPSVSPLPVVLNTPPVVAQPLRAARHSRPEGLRYGEFLTLFRRGQDSIALETAVGFDASRLVDREAARDRARPGCSFVAVSRSGDG